jgi:septum formation protein
MPGPAWGARMIGLGERTLVLASASPRRAELLGGLGVPFTRRAVDVDETPAAGEAAEVTARRLAETKARAAVLPGEDAVVLGADTVVVVDGEVLGKPRDAREAAGMLRRLSGRPHEVITGVALAEGDSLRSGVARTRVVFRALEDEDIHALVHSGEARDKAGAYGIQGLAALVVERIEGDYFNVVGLPLGLVRELLHA